MTDRRSHWDIDLVDGVGRRLIPRYRSIGYCTDAERHRIYTLIEFVEDWQAQRLGACVPQLAAWQYEKQTIPLWHWAQSEATIQRVRELHYNTATHHPSGCCSECGGTYPCPTVRALDGGAE